MKKKYDFLILAIIFFFFISNLTAFAQDSTSAKKIANRNSTNTAQETIRPVLSEDSLSSDSSWLSDNKTILLADNSTTTDYDDEFDKEFTDEFDNSNTAHAVADPLYYFNYAMYTFNDVLYTALINPLATGYEYVMPTPIRRGVRNFFHNLMFPIRFVNNILQFEIRDAGTEVGVFLINSTIGVLGFGQVAQNQFDLHTANEDLGQTLGSYNIGNGFYLVIPVLGPSTLRDVLGLAGDSFLNPINYVDPWELSWGLKVYDSLNTTSFHLGEYEELKAAAIDPYVAIKNAYIQNRIKKVKE